MVSVPLVPASGGQREKVAALSCLVCGRAPVDPAHLVPRKHGGCDDADCVLPLCRTHHRLYDHGQLRLGVHLGGGWRQERGHALTHVPPHRLRRALDGGGW
jgi:predicted restriction endonuclease